MVEVFRKLKVNRRYESSACGWCGDALSLGEDGAVCEACETPHHARCWDKENGCGQAACVSAPLHQIPTSTVLKETYFEVEMRCLHCGKLLLAGTVVCSGCQQITPPSGIYDGAPTTAPEARDAFILGLIAVVVPPILGLVYSFIIAFFGTEGMAWMAVILMPLLISVFQSGLIAIKKGRVAKSQIANDQRLQGTDLSTIGQILGAVGLAYLFIAITISMIGNQ